jgi:SHS2 domain-containing protein
MGKFYSLSPHTADIAMAVEADSLKGLYINSAAALTDILIGIENISGSLKRKLSLKGVDRDDLLIRLLNELLYLFSVERLLFSDFKIIKLGYKELICLAIGQKLSSLDKVKEDIKAVTYSDFKIEKSRNSYRARIVLDI